MLAKVNDVDSIHAAYRDACHEREAVKRDLEERMAIHAIGNRTVGQILASSASDNELQRLISAGRAAEHRCTRLFREYVLAMEEAERLWRAERE